jgi:hypothetical protein
MTTSEILRELANKRVSGEVIRQVDALLAQRDRNRRQAARIMRTLGIQDPHGAASDDDDLTHRCEA